MELNLPEKNPSLEVQLELLTKAVSELRKEILSLKIEDLEIVELALKSFQGVKI